MVNDWTYKYNLERLDKEYYLNRSGREIKYTGSLDEDIPSFHYLIAYQEFPNIKFPTSPDDIVKKTLGWVEIGSTVYNSPVAHKKLSSLQIKKLKELGLYEKVVISHKGYMIPYTEWLKI